MGKIQSTGTETPALCPVGWGGCVNAVVPMQEMKREERGGMTRGRQGGERGGALSLRVDLQTPLPLC